MIVYCNHVRVLAGTLTRGEFGPRYLSISGLQNSCRFVVSRGLDLKLESVDVNTLSEVIGLTPRQIQRLVKEGVLPKVGRGRYDLPACVQAWGAHLIQGKAPEGLSTERRRLVAAQAQRAEMENKRMAGELLLVEDVQVVLNEAMVTIVTQLNGLGGRLAGELAGMTDPGAIRQKILSETYKIRSAMADQLEALAANGGPDPRPAKKKRRPRAVA